MTRNGGGELVFLDPVGEVIPANGNRPPLRGDGLDALRQAVRSQNIEIDAETSSPNWYGQPPDYRLCVDALSSCA